MVRAFGICKAPEENPWFCQHRTIVTPPRSISRERQEKAFIYLMILGSRSCTIKAATRGFCLWYTIAPQMLASHWVNHQDVMTSTSSLPNCLGCWLLAWILHRQIKHTVTEIVFKYIQVLSTVFDHNLNMNFVRAPRVMSKPSLCSCWHESLSMTTPVRLIFLCQGQN